MHNPLHDSSAPTSTLSSLLPQSSQLFAVVVHCSKFALDVALDSVAPHVDLAAATSSRVLLLRPINGFRTSRLPLLLHSTSPRACAHVDDLSPSSFFFLSCCLLAFCPIQRRGSTPIPSQQASSSVASGGQPFMLPRQSLLRRPPRAYYHLCLVFASPRTIRTT